MNFETFKERYITKLLKSGLYESREELESDEGLNDRMAEIYLGFMVYSEYQNEQAKKQYDEMKEREQQKQKPQIYTGGVH